MGKIGACCHAIKWKWQNKKLAGSILVAIIIKCGNIKRRRMYLRDEGQGISRHGIMAPNMNFSIIRVPAGLAFHFLCDYDCDPIITVTDESKRADRTISSAPLVIDAHRRLIDAIIIIAQHIQGNFLYTELGYRKKKLRGKCGKHGGKRNSNMITTIWFWSGYLFSQTPNRFSNRRNKKKCQ